MGARFYTTHDPDAVLDYEFDWTAWLKEGDTITAASWAVTGADEALVVDDESNTTTTTKVWLSGGTAGVTYRATCHVTTAGGRQDDRTLMVRVAER